MTDTPSEADLLAAFTAARRALIVAEADHKAAQAHAEDKRAALREAHTAFASARQAVVNVLLASPVDLPEAMPAASGVEAVKPAPVEMPEEDDYFATVSRRAG